MIAQTARRLPGFRFEAQPPPPAEILPRMDVAAFVGFAASGPLHTPVAIEDATRFTEIFGDDLPLAWDTSRSEQVFAYLAPAVRAFFRNGGRRCWVIRVAGDAQSNTFPLPSLVRFANNQITPAFARARSEGSWSDSLRTSATILSRFVQVQVCQFAADGLSLNLTIAASAEVRPGDLLRLTFRDASGESYIVMTGVKSVEPIEASSPPYSPPTGAPANLVRVSGSPAVWFQTAWRLQPASNTAKVFTFARGAEVLPLNATIPFKEPGPASPLAFDLDWPASPTSSAVKLDLSIPLAQAPAPGTLVCVKNLGTAEFWLMVQRVSAGDEIGSPVGESTRIIGEGFWRVAPPSPLPSPIGGFPDGAQAGLGGGSLPIVEQLTFELWTRQGETNLKRLSDLGFAPDHPRYWAALPTDEPLYSELTDHPDSYRAASSNRQESLWKPADHPRFPLAGPGDEAALYFPIASSAVPDYWLGPDKVDGTALDRDGLAQFGADLFLDPALIEPRTADLISEADFLRYTNPTPRRLRGLHAVLGIEEVTLIAVPDAAHRGWQLTGESELSPPDPSSPFLRPDWWHFLDCDPPPVIKPASQPEWGNFLNCDLQVIQPPTLLEPDALESSGTFTLQWESNLPSATYVLEEATRPTFEDAEVIFNGGDTQFIIYGRAPGSYYYRVRAEIGGASSDWSNGVAVRVMSGRAWKILDQQDYLTDTLFAVQWALLRLCAARGDGCAILALPEHYRETDVLAHIATLKSPFTPAVLVHDHLIAALGFGEARAFSYGALYHPWLIGDDETRRGDFRSTPPEGAVTGLLAQRTRTRGAWVAPANEPLRGVVALTPLIPPEHWLDLQMAQLNLIRQEPRGMLVLNAETLSDEPDLRQLNVRRLLILLRRLALREGATYVFEPNSDAFRRLVQRGFESLLQQLFARGAFAGRVPAESFQVVVVSTPRDVEQGRFIVELRVAPSMPLTFLTLRLVQSGDRGQLVTEGR